MNRCRKKYSLNWIILLSISAAYIGPGMSRQGIMALFPFIKEEFILSRAQTGLYSTFYFISATVVAAFSGKIIDNLGAKKGMIIGAGSLGLFVVLHSLAPSYSLILLFAFFSGI